MRPVNHPYGGVNPLIDKMIGNAYDIVKYVAKYLREIRYVAENMEIVYDVAHGYRTLIVGTPEGNDTLVLGIPQDIDPHSVNGIDVVAHVNGNVYVASTITFNYGILGDEVVISIESDMNDLMYAEYRVTLSTLPPSQQNAEEG